MFSVIFSKNIKRLSFDPVWRVTLTFYRISSTTVQFVESKVLNQLCMANEFVHEFVPVENPSPAHGFCSCLNSAFLEIWVICNVSQIAQFGRWFLSQNPPILIFLIQKL